MSVLCKQLVTCYSSCVGCSHGNSLNKEVSDRMRSSLNKSVDFIYNLHTSSIGSNHIQGQLIVPIKKQLCYYNLQAGHEN